MDNPKQLTPVASAQAQHTTKTNNKKLKRLRLSLDLPPEIIVQAAFAEAEGVKALVVFQPSADAQASKLFWLMLQSYIKSYPVLVCGESASHEEVEVTGTGEMVRMFRDFDGSQLEFKPMVLQLPADH